MGQRDKLIRKLAGVQDSRSTRAMFSRGKNVYKGVSSSAHRGGGQQFGRPKRDAVLRRMRMKRANSR